MPYAVLILRRAQKELAVLEPVAFRRVCDAIRALAAEPRPQGCSKLIGRDGWRIRIGDYRVIYDIDDHNKTILILHIGHRRDIYS